MVEDNNKIYLFSSRCVEASSVAYPSVQFTRIHFGLLNILKSICWKSFYPQCIEDHIIVLGVFVIVIFLSTITFSLCAIIVLPICVCIPGASISEYRIGEGMGLGLSTCYCYL